MHPKMIISRGQLLDNKRSREILIKMHIMGIHHIIADDKTTMQKWSMF